MWLFHEKVKCRAGFTQKRAILCMLYTIAIFDKHDVCVMWKDEWNDEEE